MKIRLKAVLKEKPVLRELSFMEPIECSEHEIFFTAIQGCESTKLFFELMGSGRLYPNTLLRARKFGIEAEILESRQEDLYRIHKCLDKEGIKLISSYNICIKVV